MTKVLCLSDLHGYLPKITTTADLLLIGGDICPVHDHSINFQQSWLKDNFMQWAHYLISDGAVKTVVFVAGNHDFVYENGGYGLQARERDPMKPMGGGIPIYYLQDNARTLCGLKIWGSPWQRRFCDWAFNLDEEDLAKKWDLIPNDTDIMLLHSPVYGYGDKVSTTFADDPEDDTYWPEGQHVGSPSLLKRIDEVKPKLVVTGHIHPGYGVYTHGPTTIVNASYVNERYQPTNNIIEVTL